MTTSISPELFLAILSMDSDNRGYDAGIGDGQNGVTPAPHRSRCV
ncbi:hypothetical protein [Hoeflea alexandrii]|nr:hypothetical protein [Hoeflea alexandrii]MCY0153717.1 hypothetical protein [Hoeflea alexandrii]